MVVGVVIAIIVLIAIYVLVQYNSFVKLNNRISEAFSTMDVYLKKRWDLIPNIVETVKDYAKHESQVLEDIVKLRNSSYDKMSLSDKIETNQQLSGELSKIMAVAESYPDLKASENFLNLQKNLTKMEDQLQAARRLYNMDVTAYNTAIQVFPTNLIASAFNFTEEKLFELEPGKGENVKVNF